MPLLDHCWFCSLQVAASVIAVYISVAYVIAFLIEVWWIWEVRGQVPHLAFILAAGYLVTFVLSAVLVRGVTYRRTSYLVLWMCGIMAILLPEAGLALFMAFQFWKVQTLYGLTEVTCWACRLTVNVAGLVCIQSLHSLWQEEKEVITSLRGLNMASGLGGGRTPGPGDRLRLQNSYNNAAYKEQLDQRASSPLQHLKRAGSLMSVASNQTVPPPVPLQLSGGNSEFNASLFDTNLRSSLRLPKSKSLLDLSDAGLRPRLHRSHSVSFFPSEEGRLRAGYFPALNPSAPGYLLHSSGRVAYLHDPHLVMLPNNLFYPPSKTSLAESDDTQKYRDVAL